MTEKKTCGDCPWWDCNEWDNYEDPPEPLRGECKNAEALDHWIERLPADPECPARKAYRILRDEVRRLRFILFHKPKRKTAKEIDEGLKAFYGPKPDQEG